MNLRHKQVAQQKAMKDLDLEKDHIAREEDIFDDTTDTELKALETNITYLPLENKITITSVSDPSYLAVWDLANKTVKGQKA